jgi:hypothetical protein
VTAPRRVSPTVARVSPVRHRTVHHRRVTVSHTRHARPTVAKPVALSSPLAFFTHDLLRLVPAPIRVEAVDHRDGVLLLLASLAMGVLAVSSFALSRQIKELR